MKQILAVYNCSQMGHGNQVPYYIDALRSLLRQKAGENYHIAVSGHMINEPTKNTLRELFGTHITCNYVDENVPVSVTFNDTVNKCVEHFGPFEGYLYIDSGINFWCPSNYYDAIEKFYAAFKRHDNAVISAAPSNDDGASWWGINYVPGEDHIFRLGSATNLHCQIFPEKWRASYGEVLPTIFASNMMESVFSIMAAAIKTKYVMTQDVSVLHLHSLDGASIGNRDPQPDRYPMSHIFQCSGQLFRKTKTMDEMYAEGREFGFGAEQCKPYWLLDPTKFDNNGFALDDRLFDFLKREMYLPKEALDYSKLVTTFIPGK